MNLGDLLDGGFRMYLANWRTILIVAGIFLVPLQLVTSFLQRDMFGGMGFFELLNDPQAAELLAQSGSTGQDIAALISYFGVIFILPFLAGAVSKVVAASFLGQRLDAGPALAATARRWWALVASWVLVHLLEAAPFLLAAVVIGIGAATGAVWLVILGVLLLLAAIPVALLVMAAYVATAPAIVVEELGPIAGMRRSVSLLRPRVWPVLGVALLTGLLANILGGIIGGIPATASFFIGLQRAWILLALGSILGSLVTTPFVAVVATLLYFDGRIRQEAFDLQVMAAELGGAGAASGGLGGVGTGTSGFGVPG